MGAHVIVVVEGPSAAGKTTAALRLGSGAFVAENAGLHRPADEAELAEFWAEANAVRWERAVEVEHRAGVAVCDTDPLKLHYDFCLFRVGQIERDRVIAGIVACRRLIEQRRLGIADLIFCSIPDDDALRRQKEGDSTRSRRSFELHRRLAPPLREWYEALQSVDPRRVQWKFPEVLPPAVDLDRHDRHDLDIFDEWMRLLDVDGK